MESENDSFSVNFQVISVKISYLKIFTRTLTAAAKQERINRMCELKNVREWDGEAMAKFLSGSE